MNGKKLRCIQVTRMTAPGYAMEAQSKTRTGVSLLEGQIPLRGGLTDE